MRQLAVLIVAISLSASGIGAEPAPAAADHPRNKVLDPVHTEKYEYYEICGCSEKDLQCDLTQKAIKCGDGKRYDSVTNWKAKWDYGHVKDPTSCTTEAFTVTVDIIFRLPKWARDSKAPPQLIEKWEAYIQSLMAHETGHRDRALAAAAELTRMIADLPPARSCSELDKEVNRIARARLQKLIEEQAEYDRETAHGHAQGVQFP